MKIQLEKHEKTIESEAKRIIFSYHQLYSGFYGGKRFIVLPRKSDQNSSVIFPDLDYCEIKKLFDLEDSRYFIGEEDPKMIKKMSEIVNSSDIKISEKVFEERTFDKIIKQIEKTFSKFMTNTPDLMKLIIYETEYGTRMSFSKFTEEKKGVVKMRIFLRSDHDPRAIVTAVLMSIIADNKYKNENGDRYWQEDWEINQSIADYLMKNSIIYELFPEYNSFLESLQQDIEQGDHVLESMEYYSKLGYPICSVLEEKGKCIYFDEIDLTTLLTPTERRTLRCFIKNRGKVCSYDELSEAIWREKATEKYSLWAIAKVVQKVRDKLSEVGAPQNLIQTKRKQGYILFD